MRYLLLAILLATSTAHAQRFEIVPERAGKAPHLHVTVHGVGASVTAHTILTWDDGFAEPTQRQPYRTGPEPIAIVIVINGQEIFLGNDDFETDSNATFVGILKRFEAGLDKMHLESLVPPGSTIEVVTYSNGAKVLVPTEPVAAFHGAQLGKQKDYRNTIGSDMVEGIELAAHELDQSTAPVKLLFVLGDGNDTNNEVATHRLADLALRLRSHQIEVAGAIYKSQLSMGNDIIETLIPDVQRIVGGDGADGLGHAIDHVTDRMYLTFADDSLPWDGEKHAFTLTIADTALPPVTITMPALAPSKHVRWYQILFGIALVALIAGIVAKRRRR